MKDERILNLQKKIEEKTMERKKQAGLLKIIPQKTRIVSSKVWLLHKEKSNRPAAHRSLLNCQHWQGAEADGAIPGWQQQHPASCLGTISPALALTSPSFHTFCYDRTQLIHSTPAFPLLPAHTHPIKAASQPVSNSCLSQLPITHIASHHTGMLTPLPQKACYSLSFPWFCGELQQWLSHLKLGNPLCLLFCLFKRAKFDAKKFPNHVSKQIMSTSRIIQQKFSVFSKENHCITCSLIISVFPAGFFSMELLERTGRESGKAVQDSSAWLHGQRSSSEKGAHSGSKNWSQSLCTAL